MATSWKMQCEACSKECPELRRCTGCFAVYYCSRGCQTGHWKIHKKRCKPESKKTNGDHPPPKSSGNGDKKEAKKGDGKKGSSPRAKKAPSPPSSARDARASPPSNNGDNGVGGSDPGKTCSLCGSSKDVKSCAACGKIDYCSKTCQKADWKRHKQECVQTEGHIKTSEYQRRQREAAKSKAVKDDTAKMNLPFMHPFNMMMMQMQLEHEEERPRGSLARALTVARGRFPVKIIDDFAEIPHESPWMFFGLIPQRCVLVAFMSKYHGHVMRHGIYIKDKDDDETHVLFYIDYDSPLPYFRWEDVRPGRYICITNPRVHHFMDGSVGMRIDEPDEVAFIDV